MQTFPFSVLFLLYFFLSYFVLQYNKKKTEMYLKIRKK